jgi:hypothetical protein
MIAPLGRIISSHRGLVEACQQRAIDLEISRAELDRLAGWTDGYSAKLPGNGNSVRPKRLWPTGLELMLGVLGLKILLIEDETATAKTLSKRVPVVSSHQRFGNRSNCKSLISDSTKPADPTYAAHAASPAPQAVSRAHLRVIQTKRGGHFG